MKSTTAASLAAICALAYSSSVLAAPVDAPIPPPNPLTTPDMTPNMSQEDAAIWGGIRHGVKDGLEAALAENLGISVGHDLVREEEVDQVLDCIGDKVINKMVGCIKTEHLAMQAIAGAMEDESKHTESIQHCISTPTLEHVEYCVGKLEIQRLGEDAHILQELYNESQLKDSEYLYEHPGYASSSWPGSNKGLQSQMQKAADPLFSPSWYEMHKGNADDFKTDKLPDSHDADLMAKVNNDDVPATAAAPPAADPSKPTNSTAPSPDDANKASNSTMTPDAKPSTASTLPVDLNNKDGSIPLVKRKYGYGADWQTAIGVRDGHPLPRRSVDDIGASIGAHSVYPTALSNVEDDDDDDDDDDRAYRIQSSLVGVASS